MEITRKGEEDEKKPRGIHAAFFHVAILNGTILILRARVCRLIFPRRPRSFWRDYSTVAFLSLPPLAFPIVICLVIISPAFSPSSLLCLPALLLT